MIIKRIIIFLCNFYIFYRLILTTSEIDQMVDITNTRRPFFLFFQRAADVTPSHQKLSSLNKIGESHIYIHFKSNLVVCSHQQHTSSWSFFRNMVPSPSDEWAKEANKWLLWHSDTPRTYQEPILLVPMAGATCWAVFLKVISIAAVVVGAFNDDDDGMGI